MSSYVSRRSDKLAGKFSLLVFFRQIVIGIPKYLRIWWLVFTIVLLTYLACMLSNLLTCHPLKTYWSASEFAVNITYYLTDILHSGMHRAQRLEKV